MTDLEVIKLNESFVIIKCGSPSIEKELTNLFAIYPENYKWTPAYRMRQWDGKIKFFKKWDNSLPIGLTYKLEKFIKRAGYDITYDYKDIEDVDELTFHEFVGSLNLTYPPRDYQLEATYDACKFKKMSIESVTSSGKSLIIYMISRWVVNEGGRMLIVVPTTSLVEQLYGDFMEYGYNCADNVHKIYSGQSKFFEKPIIISTWQSIYKEPTIFENFGGLIIDESHGAKAKSLTAISQACINAKYKIGLSGTYPDKKLAEYYSIVGSLGPLKKYTTDKDLEQRGIIAKLSLVKVFLTYPEWFRKKVFDLVHDTKFDDDGNPIPNYFAELDALIDCCERTEFIAKIVKNLNQNVIILFNRIKHGKAIKEELQTILNDRIIFYVDKDIPTMEREMIRATTERKNNVVIVASYGTFRQGINIKNLHYIIFATSYKKKIPVLQSIGRGRRIKEGKEWIKVYDLIDALKWEYEDDVEIENDDGSISIEKMKTQWINYTLRQFFKRSSYYKEREFRTKSIFYDIEMAENL